MNTTDMYLKESGKNWYILFSKKAMMKSPNNFFLIWYYKSPLENHVTQTNLQIGFFDPISKYLHLTISSSDLSTLLHNRRSLQKFVNYFIAKKNQWQFYVTFVTKLSLGKNWTKILYFGHSIRAVKGNKNKTMTYE